MAAIQKLQSNQDRIKYIQGKHTHNLIKTKEEILAQFESMGVLPLTSVGLGLHTR